MIKGFKEFITRGNVVDLAVGIVIGAAFGALVDQFVKSFLDPIVKLVLPGDKIGGSVVLNESKNAVLDYGAFLTAALSFLITAFALYIFVVVPMNKLAERRKRGMDEPEAPSDEVRLLTEIRDELRGGR